LADKTFIYQPCGVGWQTAQRIRCARHPSRPAGFVRADGPAGAACVL